jgi:hypothetical protein
MLEHAEPRKENSHQEERIVRGPTPKDWVVITTTPRDDNFYDAEYTVFKNGVETEKKKIEQIFFSSENAIETIVTLLQIRQE